MRAWILTSAAALAFVCGPQAAAQTTPYGQVGKWAITRSDGRQCWLATGTATSIFALSLDNQGDYGIVFSLIRSGSVPAQINASISAMDVPFSTDKNELRKPFTKVVTRGIEHYYQARLTPMEVSVIRRRRIVTFTEWFDGRGAYANISAAHVTDYDPAADQMWRRCVAELR